MTKLAIKVDVDTIRGYKEGVPSLLGLFEKYGLKSSIFFSFGPDNSGKAIRRIFRKGFLSKMLRTKAPSTYGLKTLLYGTLLPAPLIVSSAPDILKRAHGDGHDCGVHAWDHVLAQDKLESLSESDFESLYLKAASQFEAITGEKPRSYAAPGWQVSSASFAVEDRLKLNYASDTRGSFPFLPEYKGRSFSIPQIPTTLPTMDEILGMPGVTDETLPGKWLAGMSGEWNVLTVHAEMEGISKISVFDKFIARVKAEGIRFLTLDEIAREAPFSGCAVIAGYLPGRAGSLAMQGGAP